jgi:acetolactate synthase-1/3 small subunit
MTCVHMSDEVETHTLAVLVQNEAGVLARVIGLFLGARLQHRKPHRGRGRPRGHRSRITIVTSGTPQVINQIKMQLERMVPVHEVADLTVEGPFVSRELALIKVVAKGEHRVEALRIAEIFRANVVDSTLESFVFEITGTPEKVDAFCDLMRPWARCGSPAPASRPSRAAFDAYTGAADRAWNRAMPKPDRPFSAAAAAVARRCRRGPRLPEHLPPPRHDPRREPRKIEGAIRCPYHSWCYAPPGKLVATPHVGGPGQNAHPGIDRALWA